MFKQLNKKVLIPLSVVFALAVTAAALAYWSTSGTGTGSGGAATSQTSTLAIHQTNTISGLTPGDSAPIDMSVSNSGTQAQALKGITISIASIKKADGTAATGCVAGTDFTITPASISSDVVVPAKSGTTDGSTALPSAGTGGTGAKLNFANTGSNQDACKGVTVNLQFDQSSIG